MSVPSEAGACAFCGARSWLVLPDVGEGRSVTTGGHVIDEPLGKAQCRACGFGQRTAAPLLARSDYYDRRYRFFDRPGARRFDAERYAAMARWIADSISVRPTRVLDAGCGRGWMIEALQELFPAARFSGIEPSEADSEDARRRGLDVRTGRVGAHDRPDAHHDLVYATNVLEHTASPVEFLIGLARLMAPSGEIVITCPDATRPNQELLFADQNFSMLPAHLIALAVQAGLTLVAWRSAPPHVGVRDKQLVVLRHATGKADPARVPDAAERTRLFAARLAYLEAWSTCARLLDEETADAVRLYNFGTSTWSYLLAGYCPAYWSRVAACITDGGSGEFLGKPVEDAERIALEAGDVIVLGTNPELQPRLADRFRGSPARVVSWNAIIEQ